MTPQERRDKIVGDYMDKLMKLPYAFNPMTAYEEIPKYAKIFSRFSVEIILDEVIDNVDDFEYWDQVYDLI